MIYLWATIFAILVSGGLVALIILTFRSHERLPRVPDSLGDRVKIREIPDEPPSFEREYTASLPRGVRMKVTTKKFLGTVIRSGELIQAPGQWVLFDPECPADRILDREILPAVEELCRLILDRDVKFRNFPPDRFVDNRGSIWRRFPPDR